MCLCFLAGEICHHLLLARELVPALCEWRCLPKRPQTGQGWREGGGNVGQECRNSP